MKFIIKDTISKTYYKGMTAIGPRYGASDEEAMQFDSLEDANAEMCKHSMGFLMAEVEGIDSFI